MFRIRRIHDATWPGDARLLSRAQDILREQFPLLSPKDIEKLSEQLRNPLKYKFRSILYAADGTDNRLKGFALFMHAPDLHFAYPYFSGYLSVEKVTMRQSVQKNQVQGAKKVQGRCVFIHT